VRLGQQNSFGKIRQKRWPEGGKGHSEFCRSRGKRERSWAKGWQPELLTDCADGALSAKAFLLSRALVTWAFPSNSLPAANEPDRH